MREHWGKIIRGGGHDHVVDRKESTGAHGPICEQTTEELLSVTQAESTLQVVHLGYLLWPCCN